MKTHKNKTRKVRKFKNKKNNITRKVSYLYNPNNPKKSFDVYIDKNPRDTIPIKYSSYNDIINTIQKLEYLYKSKKYSHKRIWQVGMIMKVRLEAIYKHRTTKYRKARDIARRYRLSQKYFNFLSKRTTLEEKDRYTAMFNV
jgi:hypothetical protein